MKMKSVLAVTLLVLGAVAGAQTTAAKKELAAKVLQLQQAGIEGVARLLAEQSVAPMMQQAGIFLQTRIPPDKRAPIVKDIQADVKKYGDEVLPILRDRAVKLAPSIIGPMLEERFTEDELRQIIAILESPTNRKYQQMVGELTKALSDKLVAETKGAIDPKIKALEQTVAGHLGVPPATDSAAAAPAPAATPAPAAAAKPPAKPASK